MQRKLSQWAPEHPEDQYRDLYSLLCHETWLRVAHHSVNTNQGRETAGIDGRTMSHFNGDLEGNLARLREGYVRDTCKKVSQQVHDVVAKSRWGCNGSGCTVISSIYCPNRLRCSVR